MPATLSAIVAAVLAGSAGWYLKPSPPLPVTRFAFTLPEGQAFSGLTRHLIAVSPDGSQLVYTAGGRLYVRGMSELDVKAIQGTETHQAAYEPVFSPDGRSVAFYAVADQTIKRIAVTGGAPVTICKADLLFGLSWDAGVIVFGQGGKGIMRVSPNGGTPELLYAVKAGQIAHGPQVLPGGRHLLFTLATDTGADRWDRANIVVQALDSGEITPLIEGGSDARYVPTGHIIYAVGGTVFAVGFDVKRLKVTSAAVPVIEGVRRAMPPATAAANFSVSSTGSLVYIPGPVASSLAQQNLALIDRKGGVEPLRLPTGPYSSPRVSPDGKRVALHSDEKEATISIYELGGATAMRRLTFGGNNRFPIWTSDGTRVVFQSDRDGDRGIYWQPADGRGTAERLTKPNQGEEHVPNSWSPRGDILLFDVVKVSGVSLWAFSLRDKKAAPFTSGQSPNPSNAVFSPDGRWVAYGSADGGRARTFVEPFPATGARYQVPVKGTDGPHEAVWSRDGKELFYNPRPGGFEAVSVTTEPTFGFGNPVALPRPFLLGPPTARTAYDVTPAGKFAGLIQPGLTESGTFVVQQIQVVLNWFEELKQRAPAQ